MNPADKDFFNQAKLYLATLFARTMPKLVFGVPEYPDHHVIYSNIDRPSVEFYNADAEYYIHRVELNDQSFTEQLFKRFPLLKSSMCLLETDKFLSAMGKREDLTNFQLTVVQGILYCGEPNNAVPCGELLSSYVAMRYRHVLESGMNDPVYAITKPVGELVKTKEPWLVIDSRAIGVDDPEYNRFLVIPNKSTVSQEYIKREPATSRTHQISIENQGKVAKVNFIYHSELVNVTSTQPGVVWFKCLKPKEEKAHEQSAQTPSDSAQQTS